MGNGQFLSASGDGYLVEWSVKDPNLGRVVAEAGQQLFCLAALGDHSFVVGDMSGDVHWLYPLQPERNRHIAHHSKAVYNVLRVGDTIFSAGGDGVLSKWDITQQRCTESLHLSNQNLRCLDYSPFHQYLAVGASDHHIYILDAKDLRIIHTLEKSHGNSVFCLRFSPDGNHLLSGGRDALLKVWQVQSSFALVNEEKAHLFTINDIVFSPDGLLFATASRDKTIKIWESENLRILKVINLIKNGGHTHSVNRLLWNKYGLFLASDDRSVVQWEMSER